MKKCKYHKFKLFIGKFLYDVLNPFYIKKVSLDSEESIDNKLSFIYEKKQSSCILNKNHCMKMFDLQVVVPAYNVEKYIQKCIESVLFQETRYSVKIVIINDGSTDSTIEKINKYKRFTNIYIVNQKNEGLSSARNSGIKEICADYLMFLDSDDYLLPGSIDALLDKAKENDYDIVEGSSLKEINNRFYPNIIYSKDSDVSASYLSGYSCMKLYKSSLFSNIVFPKGYWFEDTIGIHIIFPQAKRCSVIQKPIYVYRMVDSSITHSSFKNLRLIETLYVTEIVLKDRSKLGLQFDSDALDAFLKQVHINQLRLIMLSRESQLLCFQKTIYLLKKYWSNLSCRKEYKKFLSLILAKDFGRYCFWCSTHR